MKIITLIITVILYSKICYGQINFDSISNSILNEGIYLYNLEKHAWLASDIILSDKINKEIINGYVTYNDGDTTTTIFYYYTESRTEVFFTVKSPKDSNNYSNPIVESFSHKPNDHENKLIKAREEVIKIITETPSMASFLKIIDYNIAFHEKDSIIECYLMAGTNADSIVPIGADCRIDLSNDFKIINIEYYHCRFIGDRKPNNKYLLETNHLHSIGDSPFISPTEICIYKLYDSEFKNFKKHVIDGEDYTSIFNSENNTLKIITFKEYYNTFRKKSYNK